VLACCNHYNTPVHLILLLFLCFSCICMLLLPRLAVLVAASQAYHTHEVHMTVYCAGSALKNSSTSCIASSSACVVFMPQGLLLWGLLKVAVCSSSLAATRFDFVTSAAAAQAKQQQQQQQQQQYIYKSSAVRNLYKSALPAVTWGTDTAAA
jgi:hypothetical protein